MNEIDDIKKARLATKLKWGLALLGALIIAPVVFLIVKGLVGLALAGAIGLVIVQMAPVFSMKLANWKLKLIVGEAQKNPIETMIADLQDDRDARNEADQSITDYETEIGNIESNMQALTSDLHPDDIAAFRQDIAAMRTDLQLQQVDLSQFDAEIAKKEIEVRRAQAIWKMNMVIDAANAKHNARRADETMKKIKSQTAIDAVSRSSAAARAQLNQRIRNRKSGAPALTHQPADVIEMPAVTVKQGVTR